MKDPKTGIYHAFFAAMRNVPGSKGTCNLGAWTSNSEVIHAVSSSPVGPFNMQDVALPPWHHNPQVMLHPDGTWLIYTIGTVGVPPQHSCGKEESDLSATDVRSIALCTPNVPQHVDCADRSGAPCRGWAAPRLASLCSATTPRHLLGHGRSSTSRRTPPIRASLGVPPTAPTRRQWFVIFVTSSGILNKKM